MNGQPQPFIYEEQWFRVRSGEEFIPRLWATRAIGHLLTQIRIGDESEELVASIVRLSLRYGIITPYTSFLITEDDIFSDAGRLAAVQEAATGFAEPAAVSGQVAIDEAVAAGGMANAAVATPFLVGTPMPGATLESWLNLPTVENIHLHGQRCGPIADAPAVTRADRNANCRSPDQPG